MKQKIFFIIPFLTKGGAQRVVTNLSNYFINKNYSVSIIILNDCEIGYHLEDGINVIHLIKGRSTNVFSRLIKTATTFTKLFSLVKKESPDFVVSFTTSANMWTGVICNMLRVPYIVSERTVPSRSLDKFNPLVKSIVRFLYQKSNAIVVPSNGIREELMRNNRLHNIQVIKNPVTVFNPVNNKKVHNRPFILAAGRLNDVKGFDLLIEAYSKVKSKEIDLIIVGEGEEREPLTKLIADLGLSEFIFLPGRKSNMQDYYDQCDMFILSSRNEGYPNVLIEAMSAGCACLAFDCETGPSEIIENGVNGLLIKNGDISTLADAINLLIADTVLKEKLGNEAKLIGVANSMDDVAAEWENLIVNHT